MDNLELFALSNFILGLFMIITTLTPFFLIILNPDYGFILSLIMLPLIVLLGAYGVLTFAIINFPLIGVLSFIIFILYVYVTFTLSNYIDDSPIYKVTSLVMLLSAISILAFSMFLWVKGLSVVNDVEGLVEFLTVFTIITGMITLPSFALTGILLRHIGDVTGLDTLKTFGTLVLIGSIILGFLASIALIFSYFEIKKIT